MKLREAFTSPAGAECRVSFYGRSTVFVEGCESILEYRPETVKLRFRGYNLRVIGDGLLLTDLKKGSVVISGKLYSADFCC